MIVLFMGMVGWHHWLSGYEFDQASGAGDGQEILAGCSPWGRKDLDMTERMNWTDGSAIFGCWEISLLFSTVAVPIFPPHNFMYVFSAVLGLYCSMGFL